MGACHRSGGAAPSSLLHGAGMALSAAQGEGGRIHWSRRRPGEGEGTVATVICDLLYS